MNKFRNLMLFVIILLFFIPSCTSNTSDNKQTKVSGNPCGDGFCDELERVDPNLCPKD